MQPSSSVRARQTIRVLVFAATSLLLPACARPDGHEFVGQWQNVKNPSDRQTIDKEGIRFILTSNRGEKVMPTYDSANNVLRIQRGPFGELVSSYRKQTDTLMGDGDEYQRVK